MWTTTRSKQTDQERYLQSELDNLREQQERDRERAERERKERREERMREMQEAMRHAETWPEALRKQIGLMRSEIYPEDDVSDFFIQSVKACEKALELWKPAEDSKKNEISELEAKIEAIRDSIRLEVADRLVEFDSRNEFSLIADALRDGDIDRFLDW